MREVKVAVLKRWEGAVSCADEKLVKRIAKAKREMIFFIITLFEGNHPLPHREGGEWFIYCND